MSERRRFLKMLGAAGLGGALGCEGDADTPEPAGPVAAGKVADLPASGLKKVSGQRLLLGRDAAGVYAMTSLCTHTSCDMNTSGQVSASGVSCACHGSLFDLVGNVVNGPASSPLRHFRVTIAADGAIAVDTGDVVPADTRATAG